MGLTFLHVSCRSALFLREVRAHYTGSSGAPPGKKTGWLALWDGEPFAVLGVGEPAFKLAPRRRLGLMDARPLPETVSCFIFRRFSAAPVPGGDVLDAWHAVASEDWCERYGWVPVHWETMVLPSAVTSEVPGAAFRRAGYRSLGMTTGATARRPAGHSRGPRVWGIGEPKLVLYRGPLARLPR